MAHPQTEHDPQPHRFLNVVMATILAGFVGALISIVLGAPVKPSVDADSFRTQVDIDAERLREARAAKYGGVDLAPHAQEVAELRDAVRSSHELQFRPAAPSETRNAMVINLYAANEVLAATNLEGFMLAGTDVFEQCLEALDELRAAVKSGNLAIEKARVDPGPDFQKYRQNCGNALPTLIDTKIMRPNGDWVDPRVGPVMFDIINRLRWASILDLRKPPQQQLTNYEYELLTRWRASNELFPVDKRIEWVQEAASHVPEHAANEIVGNLHLEAGDVPAARDAYEKACATAKRDDMLLHAKCEWLAAQGTSQAASNAH